VHGIVNGTIKFTYLVSKDFST